MLQLQLYNHYRVVEKNKEFIIKSGNKEELNKEKAQILNKVCAFFNKRMLDSVIITESIIYINNK